MSQPGDDSNTAGELRTGLTFAVAAYGCWGFMPVYFKLTGSVASDVMVAHRIVWVVLFIGFYLFLRKRMGEIAEVLRSPKVLVGLVFSALFIGANWLIFVWAVGENRVLEVSLGYFINPLVSVLVGLAVLHERLTRAQTAAIGLAVVAVGVQIYLVGTVPWISLGLAFAFAGYGYMRKVTPVKATPGLFVETLVLFPLAFGYLLLLQGGGEEVFFVADPVLFAILLASGVVTAVPLIFFSAAARRLPLVVVGLLQYIAPSLHFLLAVLAWGEPLDGAKLVSFAIIWLALIVFSVDSVLRWRQAGAG